MESSWKTPAASVFGAVVGGLIVWFVTSIYVPTQIFKYQREAEIEVAKISAALKEATGTLNEIKASSLLISSEKRQIEEFITGLKTDQIVKQLSSDLAKHPLLNKRYGALEAKIDKLDLDIQKRFETLADIVKIDSRHGYLAADVKNVTVKFGFPVRQAWVVISNPYCVNAMSVEGIANDTVKLRFDYPATARCEGHLSYTVWAVSFDVYSLRMSLMQLRDVHDKGIEGLFDKAPK